MHHMTMMMTMTMTMTMMPVNTTILKLYWWQNKILKHIETMPISVIQTAGEVLLQCQQLS